MNGHIVGSRPRRHRTGPGSGGAAPRTAQWIEGRASARGDPVDPLCDHHRHAAKGPSAWRDCRLSHEHRRQSRRDGTADSPGHPHAQGLKCAFDQTNWTGYVDTERGTSSSPDHAMDVVRRMVEEN